VLETTPLSREKLRVLRSLDSVKIRNRRGICLVEGERSLREAFLTGNLLYLVISDQSTGRGEDLIGKQPYHGEPCYSLAHSFFKDLTGVKTGPGVLGVARIPQDGHPVAFLDLRPPAALCFLDGVREPGNVGALVRTAWALGFRGVLMGKETADPFSGKGVRSSAGGVFHLPLCRRVGLEEIDELMSGGYTLYAAQKGGEDYRKVKYSERSILALGNEAAGVSPWVLRSAHPVGIPMAGKADSLNVVVAGGIIAAEIAAMIRQGDKGKRGHGD